MLFPEDLDMSIPPPDIRLPKSLQRVFIAERIEQEEWFQKTFEKEVIETILEVGFQSITSVQNFRASIWNRLLENEVDKELNAETNQDE
jgi:hypothetical protein